MAQPLMHKFQRQYHPFVLLKMPQEKLGDLCKCWMFADDNYISSKRQAFNYYL